MSLFGGHSVLPFWGTFGHPFLGDIQLSLLGVHLIIPFGGTFVHPFLGDIYNNTILPNTFECVNISMDDHDLFAFCSSCHFAVKLSQYDIPNGTARGNVDA